MRVDLHVHTAQSGDSLTSCYQVIRWAQRRRLDAIAITDHDSIAAALTLRAMSPIPVIVGEEITTTRGEIIGLFLQTPVPPGLSPHETIRHIRGQGGLVYVPHPLDRVRRSTLDFGALMEIIDQVDLIEVLNARVTFSMDNRRASELAHLYHLLPGAGSDAHQGYEIGRAYVEVPSFSDAEGFLRAMTQAKPGGHTSLPLVHVGSTYARVAKGLMALASSIR